KPPTFASWPILTALTPRELHLIRRRLASELHFQPSEIDRLTVMDALEWLEE
ncbi:MAG: hypothetical protein RIR00_870, partial [Pseudomonadota bacterium]